MDADVSKEVLQVSVKGSSKTALFLFFPSVYLNELITDIMSIFW
jgi:hypothetical protein